MFHWTEGVFPGGAPDGIGDRASFETRGLLAGTHVASNLGWRAVEALAPGDDVLTFDHGMQPLVEVHRRQVLLDEVDIPRAHWPVHVPAGVLCNRVAMSLLPEQGVLIESENAQDAHGDPFAIVPAKSLVGLRGIVQIDPLAHMEVITLVFEQDQIVYAEGGVLAHCARARTGLDVLLSGSPSDYEILRPDAAATVIAGIVMDDLGRAAGGVSYPADALAC